MVGRQLGNIPSSRVVISELEMQLMISSRIKSDGLCPVLHDCEKRTAAVANVEGTSTLDSTHDMEREATVYKKRMVKNARIDYHQYEPDPKPY